MKTSQGIVTRSAGAERLPALELDQLASVVNVLVEGVRVDARVAADRPGGIGDADHLGPELLHDPGRPRADVAVALDDEGRVGRAQPEVRGGLAEHVDAAPAGRRLAAVRALQRDRLAGDDRRRVAVELSVLVHHPGHHLGVGVHVRGGDVPRGAEDLLDLVHERARDLLHVGGVELVGGAVDAALGAAEGDAGDRGLPGHQRGERADLVDVHLRVEADAALVGAARAVVLDAVAGVDVDLAVGETDRDLDRDLPVGGPEDDAQIIGEPEVVAGHLEVVADDVEVGNLGALARLGAALGLRLRLRLLDRFRRLVGLLALAYCFRRGLGVGHFPPRESLLDSPSSHKACATAKGWRARARSGKPMPHLVPGAIAQLGERRLCKPEAAGSSPAGSIPRCLGIRVEVVLREANALSL